MMDHGFQPAVVIETSPGNFQVWLNHGQTISDRTFSTKAAKELARRFGGDASSADWRHFGRLAGFTNQKAERLLQNGQAPRLRQWEGRVYDATEEFFGKLKSLAEKAVAERASRVTARPTANGNPVQSLSFIVVRTTTAICIALTWLGLYTQQAAVSQNSRSETKYSVREIFPKKGHIRRQVDYAERTANKALRSIESMH